MNYEEFKQEMQDRLSNDPQIGEKLGFKKVVKNNGLELDGITLAGEGVKPVIYMQSLYRDYQDGSSLNKCVQNVLEILDRAQKNAREVDIGELLDYGYLKDRLCLQAVATKGNEERLKDLVHLDKGDISLIVRAKVLGGLLGDGYMNLTEAVLKEIGVDKETVLSDAMKTAPMCEPYRLQSMSEIMSEMTGLPPEMLGMAQEDNVLYVLTNEQCLNGAAVMYYPKVMEEIKDKFPGKELAIIPSSVNEVLIVPVEKADLQMENELKELIGEVNQNVVRPEEVLGTKPFLYDMVKNEIVPMEDFIHEKEEIREMIKRAGLRPTESVVNGIKEARYHTGEKLTLKDIADLHRQKDNPERKPLKPEAEAAVEKVAEQCKAQQLAQRAARTPDVPIQ